MKTNRLTNILGFLLVGTLGSGLQAGDASGWQAGGSILQAFGTANDAMGLTTGFGVWAGYGIKTSLGGVVFRPSVGYNFIGGKGVEGVPYDADDLAAYMEPYRIRGSSLKHTLTGIQLAADALIPIFDKKANLVVGLSANKYSVKVSGARTGEYSPVDLDAAHLEEGGYGFYRSGNANGTLSVKGTKVGVRFGVEFAMTDKLNVRALFQQTEMGRSIGKAGQLPTVQPAWLEVGVTYRF